MFNFEKQSQIFFGVLILFSLLFGMGNNFANDFEEIDTKLTTETTEIDSLLSEDEIGSEINVGTKEDLENFDENLLQETNLKEDGSSEAEFDSDSDETDFLNQLSSLLSDEEE
jgi:hypothetical protein